MTPPFFTASFSRASAAVVPWVPQTSRPISSRIRATESPMAGVGARDRSTMPKGASRRLLASWATSWPMRVTWNAVFLMVSATTSKGCALHRLQGVIHHAGAGNAHVDDAFRLAHAVEGAGHEGVVLHGVAEHHQLGAAQAVPVRRPARRYP